PVESNGAAQRISDALDATDAEISRLVAEAQQFAESSPWPDPATAATHVYAVNAPASVRVRSGTGAPPSGSAPRPLTFMQATSAGLAEEMAANPTIFVMGEGIGQRGGNFKTTMGLYEKYGPERLRDTPICERGFVGLACGAAMTGSRPVVDFMFAD